MLIDKYSGLIASIVRTNLGKLKNYEEECVSDVFLAIWDNIEYFEKDKNTFKNWICVIAKYKAVNTSEINEDTYYIDKNLLSLEIKQDLEDIFKHLNEKDKDIFKKYYLREEDPQEIAKENNITISSLYSRLYRCRKKIR